MADIENTPSASVPQFAFLIRSRYTARCSAAKKKEKKKRKRKKGEKNEEREREKERWEIGNGYTLDVPPAPV